MFKLLLLTITLMYTNLCMAEVLSDPMRPPVAPVVAKAQKQKRFALSAILYSNERRVAIINGQAVGEGGKVAGARVRAIRRDSLDLDIDGRIVKLALASARGPQTNRSVR